MSNCKIILSTDNTGQFHYQVVITRFDVIGTLYPFEGNEKLVTEDEANDINMPLATLNGGYSRTIPRSKTYQDITHKNIRTFLLDTTGSVNQDKLNLLYRLWQFGTANPTIEFAF